MSFLKSIISFFLLLSYSLGFAHDLIPHYHIGDEIEHIVAEYSRSHYHLEHHKHTEVIKWDKDDLKLRNHLGISLFNYIVCLLTELEHPKGAHQHYVISAKSNETSEKVLKKNKLKVIDTVIFSKYKQKEILVEFDRELFFNYHTPFILSSYYRGPPFIS